MSVLSEFYSLFAGYPVAFLITAPIVGANLEKMGRKNSILIGLIGMSLATVIFALGSYCKADLAFFFVSLFARLSQGVSDAFI